MRGLSFARYLPQAGCRLWVVTARNASNAYYDPSLVAQVPPDVEVHRTFTPELPFAWRTWLWKRLHRGSAAQVPTGRASAEITPGRLARLARSLATPDPQRVWIPFAVRRAERLIRRHSIDTVIVSVPPFSELAAAVQLKRRFPGLRVVLDFRDEWLDFTLSSIETPGAAQKRRSAAVLERQAVEAADLVISVTSAWVDQIRARYPEQPREKFRLLPNGYDDEVFRNFTPRPHAGGKLVMIYMGTAYARPVYSPEPFLNALDGLEESVRRQIELRFVGRVEPELDPLLANRGYDIVRHGFLPQGEGLRILAESDILLLFANDPQWQPAKLFEYIASRKPILAIAPEDGEAARVIRETATGWTVPPGEAEAIRARVLDLVRRRGNGDGWGIRPSGAAIERYSRSALARRLAEMLGSPRTVAEEVHDQR
jgi:glycosyltransferase involved in cell wall biosynthesis